MTIVHLAASPFLGGPERQLLGLAQHLPGEYRTAFLSFSERGLCRPFLDEARRLGCEAIELEHNASHLREAVRELAGQLRRLGAEVLCCHGYKPDVLGLAAARRVGVPVVSVSRGWTGATLKVKLNEALDRLCLHAMDRVVCVSEGQAVKVRRAGVSSRRVIVIRNAIRADRFEQADPSGRAELQRLFAEPRGRIIGAAGRLSPEKGFAVLVDAAAIVLRADPSAGFVLFGAGPLREALERQISALRLEGRFVLAGFRSDLDRVLPNLDVVVLPSFTEGLPNIALEAAAAGVPVVATAVGGTPEVVADGLTGYLVPPGDPAALARRIGDVLRSETHRQALGDRGRERIRDEFTFEAQSLAYQRLFDDLAGSRDAKTGAPGRPRLLW